MNHSKAPIGIDHETIHRFSEHIREAWNNFFWEYRICQHCIRFTAEERTNYFGDLFNYFDDITVHLATFKGKENYHSALYDAVAVLQFMYIQQDLMDEILVIFKLPQSSSNDKNLVRSIRNELIGHPISRDKDKNLVSSVFITAQTKGNTLQYLRYHRDNNFSHNVRSFDWINIFNAHDNYLKTYLALVVEKIGEILSIFQEKLERLNNVLAKVSFEKLVVWVDQIFESFHRDSYLYKKENILHCFFKRNVHIRYSHAVDQYAFDLNESLIETASSIEDYKTIQLNKTEEALSKPQVVFNYVVADETSEMEFQKQRSIHYEFGKLFEKHVIFGVDYFMATYQDDQELLDELINMKNNMDNEAEYYASYEYLRLLFRNRGLL